MKTFALSLVLSMLLPAAACAANGKAKAPPQKKACRVEMKSMTGENPKYKYDLKYPQFASPCRSLNPRFRAFAAGALNDFIKNYGSIDNANGQKNEVATSYTVFCSSQHLVSVRLNTYMYTGGAHGLSSIDTINVNPGAGVDQTLSRLVPDTGYALEQSSKLAREDLLAQLKAAGAGSELDMKWFEQGTSSAAANFALYTLDGQGNIYFQFPQYQFAPYCYGEMQSKLPLESLKKKSGPSTIANPASVNCIKLKGRLEILKKPDGGEYGVCVFEDNRQCEEWALFRKECPAGGVKVTGYTSPDTVYCAITGHAAVEGSGGKPATCTADGKTCPAAEFYKNNSCDEKKK